MTKIISEKEIEDKLIAWIRFDADCSDLEWLAGELFGGQYEPIYNEETEEMEYHLVWNENYGGAFGSLARE